MSIISVSEANKYIKQLFDEDRVLRSIFIRGEISNFKKHHSGHCYFTLKDVDSTLRAVMFRSRAQYTPFMPKDGQKVIAAGSITVFERDGQYQMYVDQLIPDGAGELSLAFEQLKEKLANEGLFDEKRKRSLPIFPLRVGIITSPTGAAIRDVVTVAKRRNPGIALILVPVKVQGMEAPEQIVRAIEILNYYKKVDVIIVGRGGGSLEELWSFNDERVVRAISASLIPVVSAVGHETDFTLADFAADRRAATPSQAAELTVPDVRELERYVKNLRSSLDNNIRVLTGRLQHQVQQLRESRAFNRPIDLMYSRHQLVDMLISRMHACQKRHVEQKQYQLQVASEKLCALSPLSVLARGYVIVRTLEGKVIRNAGETNIGQNLEVILDKGKLTVSVLGIEGENNVSQTNKS